MPETRGLRPVRALPAVLFAGLLVAALPLASNANRSAAPAEPAAPEPVETVVYGSPETSAAVEDGAPGTDGQGAGGRWCTGTDVETDLGTGDAATGHRVQEILLTNSGASPCLLPRYPDLAFDDQAGSAMGVFFFRGGSFMTEDPGRTDLLLRPGASARALIGWNAMSAAGDVRAGTMLVAPYAGTERQKLAVDFDIVNGGAVAVTAWHPVD